MVEQRFTTLQMITLVVLRVLIGWHFLYEGVSKILEPTWSAAGFLMQSRGTFSDFFRWLGSDPDMLERVNQLNMWGLALIGLGLILGCFTRVASACGVLFLLLLYLCNPPFIGYFYTAPMEGNYLIVNKNLVELGGLLVILVTPSGRFAGLDRIIHGLLQRNSLPSET